jgi:hypothetical protein
MNRRGLLRGATLAAAAHATGLLALSSTSAAPTSAPLSKIALEEHFMVPDFMEYFAETYPNIDPALQKLAPPAMMDFGERRLSTMDEHHIAFVVLSLAGPGVLVFAGVFERHPNARLILGHMGETLPFYLWRFDSRWLVCNRGTRTLPQPPSFYIRRNIAITTSGICDESSLRAAIESMGDGNVMFSVDYPFEKTDLAAQFIERAAIPETQRHQVANGNAKRILRLNRI